MKIAIFGDSFADPLSWNKGLAWHELLANKGYHIDNYSQSGASQLWIWQQFEQQHLSYDRVIVIKTSCRRLWLPHMPGTKQHFTGIDDLENFKKKARLADNDSVKAIELYYRYIQNDSIDLAISQLILAQIKLLRPDALIIPALRLPQDSYPGDRDNKAHLEDIYYLNLKQARKLATDDSRVVWGNRLICHMNRQNNQQLAQDIIEWTETGQFQLILERYQAFEDKDLDYYFPGGK